MQAARYLNRIQTIDLSLKSAKQTNYKADQLRKQVDAHLSYRDLLWLQTCNRHRLQQKIMCEAAV